MLNELFIVCRSQTHAGNLQSEANPFSGVQSPGRGSQTLVCKTNIWEIIKKCRFIGSICEILIQSVWGGVQNLHL